DEPNVRIGLDVEEVRGAQVLVPLRVPGVDAVGLDRELRARALAEGEDPAVAVEATLHGDEAVEVAHLELDARARRIKDPQTGGVGRALKLGCRWCAHYLLPSGVGSACRMDDRACTMI